MRNFGLERALSGDIEPPVIRLDEVSKDYADDRHAIKKLNLVVNKGEFVFVVGSSGSGKSTLIKLLLREIAPTSGDHGDVDALVLRERRDADVHAADIRLRGDLDVGGGPAARHLAVAPDVVGALGHLVQVRDLPEEPLLYLVQLQPLFSPPSSRQATAFRIPKPTRNQSSKTTRCRPSCLSATAWY